MPPWRLTWRILATSRASLSWHHTNLLDACPKDRHPVWNYVTLFFLYFCVLLLTLTVTLLSDLQSVHHLTLPPFSMGE